MKLRTPPPVRKPVTIFRPDGTSFESSEEITFAPVPVPPKDWDQIATRAAVSMVLALTAVAVVWSTWSIGSLLSGGPGYLAAAVFDLSWGTCLILEWKARFDPAKRTFPRRLGWALLAVTMAAIFWNGAPHWGLAVVGALTSAVAKVLWLGIMKHIDRELTPRDRDGLADLRSRAHVRLATASVEREVARVDAAAEAARRSLEPARPSALTLTADAGETGAGELEQAAREQGANIVREHANTDREQIASTISDVREQGEQIANTPPVTSANTDRPVFGFGANTPNMAALVREQIAITPDNTTAVSAVMTKIPNANRASVSAAVRRARKEV
ncbi:hypothetical protein [Streptomyces sp. NPDC007172]|uniref:hypothetical protein n=1 Tax=Streptomyces sp. NPDC007172 TaxID=3364776 RepID=UPI0036AF4649